MNPTNTDLEGHKTKELWLPFYRCVWKTTAKCDVTQGSTLKSACSLNTVTLATPSCMHPHTPQNEFCCLFIAVPLRKVKLYSEAPAQVLQDILLCKAACLQDCSQHLGHAVHVKGVAFFSSDQLLKNLVVWEINQCLEDTSASDQKKTESQQQLCLKYNIQLGHCTDSCSGNTPPCKLQSTVGFRCLESTAGDYSYPGDDPIQ